MNVIPSSSTKTVTEVIEVEDGRALVKEDPADFRLMLVYQSKILEQLEKLNTYMAIITGEEKL